MTKKIIIIIGLFLFFARGLQAEERYKRIVSLAPSVTESLYELGADNCLVGVTSYCNYPKEAKMKEIVGTLTEINIEKIYALSPDLVIAVRGINRPAAVAKLKDMGLKVTVLDECNDAESIFNNFLYLGQLTDKEAKAEEITKEVKDEMDRICGKNVLPRRVFWEVGARPLVTIGRGCFAGEFIKLLGGVNIFEDTSVKYPRVSREEVLNRNPEVIILVTMGDVTEKEKNYWRGFKELDAVRHNRIYIVDADKVCRPTPLSFLAGLKELAALLSA